MSSKYKDGGSITALTSAVTLTGASTSELSLKTTNKGVKLRLTDSNGVLDLVADAAWNGTVKWGDVAVNTAYALDLCDASKGNLLWGTSTVQGFLSKSGGAQVDLGALSNHPLTLCSNGVERVRLKTTGDVVIGAGDTAQTSLATNATGGFLRLPGCAGAPTGAAVNGSIVVDTTGSKLYVRVGGAWVSATLA